MHVLPELDQVIEVLAGNVQDLANIALRGSLDGVITFGQSHGVLQEIHYDFAIPYEDVDVARHVIFWVGNKAEPAPRLRTHGSIITQAWLGYKRLEPVRMAAMEIIVIRH